MELMMRRLLAVLFSLVVICASVPASSQVGQAPAPGQLRPAPAIGPLVWSLQNGGTALSFTGTPTLPQSFPSVPIGTASADRFVVVAISWKGAGASNGDVSPTGVIVNGVTLTPAVDMWTNATGRGAAIFYGLVTSGTSVTVSVTSVGGTGWWDEGLVTIGTFTGSATASVASTIGNLGSPTPPAPYQGGVNSNAASVTVPANGLAVLATFSGDSPGVADTTWTNATKDLHTNLTASTAQSVAHTATSNTVTAVVSGNAADGSGWVAAVFQP
jgi:hypothetical protein